MYIHRSCHTRNWGEGAFAPPPLDGQGKASTPPPLILAISYGPQDHRKREGYFAPPLCKIGGLCPPPKICQLHLVCTLI